MLNFYVNIVMLTGVTAALFNFIIFNYRPRCWDYNSRTTQNVVLASFLANTI